MDPRTMRKIGEISGGTAGVLHASPSGITLAINQSNTSRQELTTGPEVFGTTLIDLVKKGVTACFAYRDYDTKI
jgi:hypothetical protein